MLGLIGVVVLIGGASLGNMTQYLIGELAIVASAFSYAVSSVFARRFNALGVPPLATAAGLLTCLDRLLFPIVLFVDRPWTAPAEP